MKLLRILTGAHAGAQLQLRPGRHRVGADDDADIRLTDWRGPDALLQVDATGVVSAQRIAVAVAPQESLATAGLSAQDVGHEEAVPGAQQQELVLLVDFVPMQFDDTILCVGAHDVPWPSDFDLLSTLLARPAEAKLAAERRKRRRYTGMISGCFVAAAVLLGATLFFVSQMGRPAPPRNADESAQRIGQALAAAHISGLSVHPHDENVVIAGMVASVADDQAVRALLGRISPTTAVARNYDIAENDARSIEDSLGITGARVQYVGGGEFAVTGAVSSKPDLDAAVARVRSDLDANVRKISVRVTETSSADRTAQDPSTYSEMVSADDVKYAQTSDGVKHIFAIDPPAKTASGNANPVVDDTENGRATPGGSEKSFVNAATPALAVGQGAPSPAMQSNSDEKAPGTAVDRATTGRSAATIPLPDSTTLPPGAHTF